MAVQAQLFTASHAEALRRADALDGDRTPADAVHLDLPALTPVDLELLGEVAARAVQFGHGDLDVTEVDLEREQLFRLPEFWVEALAELVDPEDPEAPGEVAEAWVESAELTDVDAGEVVRSIATFAAEARDAGLTVYLWTTTPT